VSCKGCDKLRSPDFFHRDGAPEAREEERRTQRRAKQLMQCF
jgi:hypothetical protein